MPDELTPDDDARLSALYREAEDDVEPPGEWSSLRELIGAARASGFDEEPSPRIDALLMAAARQHAPEPKRSWWARLASWMKPVVMHPAMAGAAALVVVAGAAGVMYRRGDGEVARPAPPDERSARVTADRGENVSGGMPPPNTEALAITPPANPPEPVPPAVVAPPAVATSKPATKPRDSKPVPDPGTARKGGAGGSGALAGESVADEIAPKADGDAPVATAPDDSFTAVPPPPPPPAAPPKPAQSSPTEERERQQGGATLDSTTTNQATSVSPREVLLRDARAAARRGDCVSVTSMSAKVRALDPAYHRDVFVRDPDVARCLAKP